MNEAALNWQSLGLDGDTLAHRRSLIEASAGTGKTWTISTLYLRLVTERGWRASQVVVTTFTDAAAQELRERRRRMHCDCDSRCRNWIRRRSGRSTVSAERS